MGNFLLCLHFPTPDIYPKPGTSMVLHVSRIKCLFLQCAEQSCKWFVNPNKDNVPLEELNGCLSTSFKSYMHLLTLTLPFIFRIWVSLFDSEKPMSLAVRRRLQRFSSNSRLIRLAARFSQFQLKQKKIEQCFHTLWLVHLTIRENLWFSIPLFGNFIIWVQFSIWSQGEKVAVRNVTHRIALLGCLFEGFRWPASSTSRTPLSQITSRKIFPKLIQWTISHLHDKVGLEHDLCYQQTHSFC